MYEKLNLLAKSIASKFATQPEKEAFAVETVNRLSQISSRCGKLPSTEEEAFQDGYITGRLRRLEVTELDDRPINHWCADQSRYVRQTIRQGEQLSGAEKCFEIDPIARLVD